MENILFNEFRAGQMTLRESSRISTPPPSHFLSAQLQESKNIYMNTREKILEPLQAQYKTCFNKITFSIRNTELVTCEWTK